MLTYSGIQWHCETPRILQHPDFSKTFETLNMLRKALDFCYSDAHERVLLFEDLF